MKLCNFFILFIFAFVISIKVRCANKGNAKYEKAHRDCTMSEYDCGNYLEDENCVMQCISKECYKKFVEDHLIEMGEVNFPVKKQFEACFNNFMNK